ncbi:MAG TPA: type II secretion system F family protein [Candidatus Rubrimentiphilum sp.]|nr:type II secretion system F family protein [Candidatus Rubrimentiphilum sp.]
MIMIVAIALLGMLAAFLFAISLIPQKSPLKKTLEELEARGMQRDSKGVRSFDRLFSKERRGRLLRKLMEAGWYTVTPAQMGARIVAFGCVGLILSFVLLEFIHASLLLAVVISVVMGAGVAYLPMSALERACEARKVQVQKSLPDFLDMVATTVQAGLSVNAALGYSIDAAPGALGDEIKSTLSEIRLGRSRSDAMRGAAERLQQQQFSTTVTAITQAERLGTNISKVLNELAEDVRNQRIMLVEEHAAKLPVKMVFPMALFMLPAIFVVIFGALVANYFSQ